MSSRLALQQPAPAAGPPATLLLVDPDPAGREAGRAALASPAMAVVAAGDGAGALDILAGSPVDLVLAGLDLPKVDGLGLTRAIRADERLKHLPVVLMAADGDGAAIDRAFEAGASGFAVTPVNWRILGQRLRYHLRLARAEAELRQARDQAEAAAALRSNILALMSHETRTPLSVILGFASLIAAEAEKGRPDLADHARQIHDAGERLFATLTDLQLYAEVSVAGYALGLDRFSASEIARAALQQARLEPARRAIVRLAPELEAAQVTCDGRLATAALAHLIRNAGRHAGAGSAIVVGCAEIGRDGLDLTVADDGKGMDAATAAVAAQPFFERRDVLMRQAEGLGLGLPTAKRVAELHGGAVRIDTAPGRGTTVTLELRAERRG